MYISNRVWCAYGNFFGSWNFKKYPFFETKRKFNKFSEGNYPKLFLLVVNKNCIFYCCFLVFKEEKAPLSNLNNQAKNIAWKELLILNANIRLQMKTLQ